MIYDNPILSIPNATHLIKKPRGRVSLGDFLFFKRVEMWPEEKRKGDQVYGKALHGKGFRFYYNGRPVLRASPKDYGVSFSRSITNR
jgi:hypothetical protein